jgi:choline dehydrogenase-like flavoprotein
MKLLAEVLESPLEAIAAGSVDCLVIGSGTAGVTTAVELAEGGLRVAIVEAGPFLLTQHVGSGPFATREDLVPKIHDLVRYETVWTSSDKEGAVRAGAVPGNNSAWSAVGGRTLFWGGCTPRFLDGDFHGWPYGADEVRPWYDRAEHLIRSSGTDGPANKNPPFVVHVAQDSLIARLRQAGIPATHAPLGVDTGAVRDGRISCGFDSSVARLLRCPLFGHIRDGARLSLAAQAAAIELTLSEERVTAAAVHDRRTGRIVQVPASHFVLAGSAIQSTRLAMASGLQRIDPLVGRYVGDHLFRQAVLKLPEPLGERALYIFLPPLPDRPFHVQMQGMLEETWYSPLHATVWLDGKPHGQYILYYCFGISEATAGSRVVLTTGAGSLDNALRNYYVINDRSKQDLLTLAEMSDFLPRVATAMGAEVVRTEENCAGAALHEFGGLRMGTDPTSSVTDPTGRFWRIPNLSCADSATWPNQGSANSYLTITAIALRNAALLAGSFANRQNSRP